MPIIESEYDPPRWLRGGHVQTLYPFLFRERPAVRYARERLELADGDFLDLDWSLAAGPEGAPCGAVALVMHGLEGHSGRKYVRGMVHALNTAGVDVCAMNHRGCSGEPNRLPRTYHSGETDDVHAALTRVLARGGYGYAGLVGFSMGGNQVAKYLGEAPDRVPPQVRAGVAVSAPLDLAASARVLERGASRLYQAYLMRSLRAKVREKHAMHPRELPVDGLDAMTTFREFDDVYTAPLNGFADAADYYARCSGGRYLDGVRVPLLVLSAADDPFLAPECFPHALARGDGPVHLEAAPTGGHVGFVPRGGGAYWSERRAAAFLSGHGVRP